jgi:hypothetical protein
MMPRQRTTLIVRTAASLFLLAVVSMPAAAQSRATADGPGSYIQVGGTGSIFQADYGQRHLGGESIFIDANLYRRIGVEAEGRVLNLNEDEDVHETTYLAGPRYSILPGRIRPYAKFLIGRGQFGFPFHYAQGSYFVIAPGAGVDWQVGRSRLTIRLVDIEFQKWPQFSFGPLQPYGVSSGIALRVF